jgi:ribosomal protein S21
MKVKLEQGESVESLIRRFIKKVKKSGLMDELMERRSYKKPSVVAKEKERKRQRVIEKLKEEHQKGSV